MSGKIDKAGICYNTPENIASAVIPSPNGLHMLICPIRRSRNPNMTCTVHSTLFKHLSATVGHAAALQTRQTAQTRCQVLEVHIGRDLNALGNELLLQLC